MATTVQMQHLDELAQAQGPASQDITPVNECSRIRRWRASSRPSATATSTSAAWSDPTRTDRGRRRRLHRVLAARYGRLRGRRCSTGAPCPPSRNDWHPCPSRSERAITTYNTYALDALASCAHEPGPEVRHGPRPPPASSLRLRPRWLVHRGRRGSRAGDDQRRCYTTASWTIRTRASQAILTELLSAARGPSGRSSSSRPTRDLGRRRTAAEREIDIRLAGRRDRDRSSSRSTGSSTPGTCRAARTSVSTRR